jgi:hypothetical protein
VRGAQGRGAQGRGEGREEGRGDRLHAAGDVAALRACIPAQAE